MGSELGAMPSPVVLLLLLFSVLPLQAQEICCQVKKVTGSKAGNLAGTYNFLKTAGTKDPNCSDGCIYTKEGAPGEEYCFTPVPEADGADITEEQCAAPTGTTGPAGSQTTAPAGPQTTASSEQLRAQAEAAAARVSENQQKIQENVDKIEKGEEATTVIADIQAKLNEGLTTSGGRLREKRQAGTTVPVATPTNCNDFGTTFEALLDLAMAVEDSNILQINVYVLALKPVDASTICDDTQKAALAAKTNTKATTATGKTKEYTGKKNSENENLKAEVNKDLEIQKEVNEKLKVRDEPTVPVAASTYAIQPTTPNVGGGETSPVAGKPKETTPGGGQPQGTSPGGGQPQGTSPGGGQPQETSPGGGQPQGTTPKGGQPEGSTPGGSNPQETPGGTPKISTAKPGRLFLNNRRRRGVGEKA